MVLLIFLKNSKDVVCVTWFCTLRIHIMNSVGKKDFKTIFAPKEGWCWKIMRNKSCFLLPSQITTANKGKCGTFIITSTPTILYKLCIRGNFNYIYLKLLLLPEITYTAGNNLRIRKAPRTSIWHNSLLYHLEIIKSSGIQYFRILGNHIKTDWNVCWNSFVTPSNTLSNSINSNISRQIFAKQDKPIFKHTPYFAKNEFIF